jgi:hypothetical protein
VAGSRSRHAYSAQSDNSIRLLSAPGRTEPVTAGLGPRELTWRPTRWSVSSAGRLTASPTGHDPSVGTRVGTYAEVVADQGGLHGRACGSSSTSVSRSSTSLASTARGPTGWAYRVTPYPRSLRPCSEGRDRTNLLVTQVFRDYAGRPTRWSTHSMISSVRRDDEIDDGVALGFGQVAL